MQCLIIRGGVEDTRLEAKGQPFRGQTLSRPRTGMLEAKAKDTSASALRKKKNVFKRIFQAISKKKKKRSLQKFFKRSPQKNVFQKIFQALHKILTIQKLVLSSSRGQANFRGLEAKDLTFEAKDFKMCPRGQGRPRGLHLCSSSPIICFSIIVRTAFTDVSFVWPYIAQVNCSRLSITSGFTDQPSPNCLQKQRESRLQYVYTISLHTIKESHRNAARYFGMPCSFLSCPMLPFPINALVASSPVNACKPSSILQ